MLKRVKDCLLLNRRGVFSNRAFSSQPDVLQDQNVEVEVKDAVKEVSMVERFKESLTHTDYFKVADLFNIEDLFNAKVHLGHKEGTLSQYMRSYIFGSRLGHLVIDLDQTAVDLRKALNMTAHVAFRGGIVLFICRNVQHQASVEQAAAECGEYSHTRFWLPGMFTESTGHYGHLIRLPDLLIFINTQNDVLAQHDAVIDAAKMLIPSVGILDTNCDPRLITYPVAGNDDSMSSINLYCKLFSDAINRGKAKRKELFPS